MEQGSLQQARLIFEAVLQENPRSEEAWLALADALTEEEDKRICYENILKINKNNKIARERLRSLTPQANPFVAAMRTSSKPEETVSDDEDEADEDEDDDDRPSASKAAEKEETSTAVLVMLGLALSVIVFAFGSGVIYIIITSIYG